MLCRDLFDDSRWSGLVDSFHADLFRLHSLTPESMLEVTLKAGAHKGAKHAQQCRIPWHNASCKAPLSAAADPRCHDVICLQFAYPSSCHTALQSPVPPVGAFLHAPFCGALNSWLFNVVTGLAALKTPEGLRPGANPEDPLQRPAFRTLAADLPFSKHVLSKLLCAVTGQVMSDANPPMVLPNGYVYSQQGIEQLQARSGDGTITCPKTGQTFSADELRRAYIV